ncbi:phage baseplate upper protein [Staphylococcus arlettae]|uniref:BppU family phage baseplate upper protein n=1 Tax=Staphylococcus arlettae TaxID=29378 RepID=UPI001E404797|nr:BppU family phage baseplate upper protein [Staphylococcus arlettae]MCD8832767.1 phage baseplate upper protein [Staphylococcus arlettae]
MYKYKKIKVDINEKNIDLGSIKTKFYTKDKHTAVIYITLMQNGEVINLNRTNFEPKLDIFSNDGSIFTNEQIEISNPEIGLLRYNISEKVIKHAGTTNAKLFLENGESSIHAANFTFYIENSGVEDAVAKEISVDIVSQKVLEIIDREPKKFKGEKGDSFKFSDLTDEQLEELKNTIDNSTQKDKVVMKTTSDSLFVIPPNKEHLRLYAEKINDKYFNSFQTLKTVPNASLNRDSSFEIQNDGYFFYYFNAIDVLAPGKKFSFDVMSRNKNDKLIIEYGFLDSNKRLISNQTIVKVNEVAEGQYQQENILIPYPTQIIVIRIDGRKSKIPTHINYMHLFSGALNKVIKSNHIDAINELSGEVADLKKQIQTNKTENNDSDIVPINLPLVYKQPKNFLLKDHVLNGKIYTDGNGKYQANIDLSTFKNNGGVTYYVSGSGSDENNGTRDSPLKKISTALSKEDVGTIMIDGKYDYYRDSFGDSLSKIDKSINIIGYNGKPKLIATDKLQYSTLENYVKKVRKKYINRVIDLNNFDDVGDYLELTKMTSLDDVKNTNNSWFIDSDTLYINGESDSLVSLINKDLLRINGNHKIYLQNLELIGGSRNIRFQTSTGKLILKDIKASYSVQSNGNGIEMIGGSYSISENVEVSQSMMDGFNYHVGANGELPYFIEINCIGRDNGFEKGTSGQKSNNGSTAHDGVKGIRLNGIYTRNDGGNIADVNEHTHTLNLGCNISESYQPYIAIVSEADVYLEFCKVYGNETAIKVAKNGNLFERMNQITGISIDVEGNYSKF